MCNEKLNVNLNSGKGVALEKSGEPRCMDLINWNQGPHAAAERGFRLAAAAALWPDLYFSDS